MYNSLCLCVMQVPIFNNVVLCIIVETVRALLFHLGAPAYMSFRKRIS